MWKAFPSCCGEIRVGVLWGYEFVNVLRNHCRAKQVMLDQAKALLIAEAVEMLVVETVHPLAAKEVAAIALADGLTAYDASYVWLAKARGLKLHTRDEELLRKCQDVAVPMPTV
jgi:predicted nucleic acid-binding protein